MTQRDKSEQKMRSRHHLTACTRNFKISFLKGPARLLCPISLAFQNFSSAECSPFKSSLQIRYFKKKKGKKKEEVYTFRFSLLPLVLKRWQTTSAGIVMNSELPFRFEMKMLFFPLHQNSSLSAKCMR